jgi:ABC-2 type transport system permease protein
MLVGSCVFMVVTLMMWLIGYWVRREQETGTLESMYLAPAKRLYVLAGVTTYAFIRSFIVFVLALFLGSLAFGVNPLSGNVLAAFAFVAVGFLPLWGIGFLFGAFILKIKEANSVIQLVQWVVAFLMGIYYPISFFPTWMQYAAASFPPTVLNDGIRSSLLNIGNLFGSEWWVPFALLCAFSLILPLLGYEIFLQTERRLKRTEGVGQY